MKLRANGILVNYEITGKGECLVLIHGAGHNLNGWYFQVPTFSQRYQVLTYDVRGHGETELGEPEGSQETWADDLFELLKTLNIDQAYVVGHSMGGGIAATLALTHPEVVKALVLSNSYGVGPFSEEEIEQAKERLKAPLARLDNEGMSCVVEQRLETSFSPGFVERNPAFIEWYRKMVPQTRADNYSKIITALLQRTAPDFTKVTCPTLIIGGEYEGTRGPEAGRRVQQMIPGSELRVFPTGHHPFLEQPETYNAAILQFLAKVGAR